MNKNILRNLSYGVYVVSTLNGEKPTGCIANSAMQVTHDTIAVSINHENFTNECIKKAGKFAISILGVDVNDNIIPVFGFTSGRDRNKFENVESEKIDGLNVISDSTGYIVCDVINTMETETHTIFLGRIIDGDTLKDQIPMSYAYYHKVKKGNSPKAAPTFIEDTPKPEAENSKPRYKCTICGYIYEGDLTKEPDDYVCPLCKQGKDKFIKI
ncbi:MAG: flavin reductase [Candidatus Gastranaerophilaceae bacterium]|nr:flavin reductase [Candidatus Gastranaerophilaceae bacterium]